METRCIYCDILILWYSWHSLDACVYSTYSFIQNPNTLVFVLFWIVSFQMLFERRKGLIAKGFAKTEPTCTWRQLSHSPRKKHLLKSWKIFDCRQKPRAGSMRSFCAILEQKIIITLHQEGECRSIKSLLSYCVNNLFQFFNPNLQRAEWSELCPIHA